MIDLPDQPLARRVLTGALSGPRVPQQFLLFGPPGTGKRDAAVRLAHALIGMPPEETHRASLDLSIVRATGVGIRQEELDDALLDLSARAVVGDCRVVVIEGAERLTDTTGSRMLKPLEEPPPGARVILVTDRPEDLLPTIRSRCLPVPFRNPGWRTVAGRLVESGTPPERADGLARSLGARALAGDPFVLDMTRVGVEMGLGILEGGHGGGIVASTQAAMERAAAENPSDELRELRAAAAELEGKRGGKTAAKRAEDQEKRERRRAVTDGWTHVLAAAASVVADGLAVALGAEGAVRHRDLLDRIRLAGAPAAFCERVLDDFERVRSEFQLNPTVDLAAQALLLRVEAARRGEMPPLVPPGRLPY